MRGSDYSISGVTTDSGMVSVSSGVTTATIAVAITDDSAEENSETVVLTLTGGSGYTVGSPSAHTLTIRDDDRRTFLPPPPLTAGIAWRTIRRPEAERSLCMSRLRRRYAVHRSPADWRRARWRLASVPPKGVRRRARPRARGHVMKHRDTASASASLRAPYRLSAFASEPACRYFPPVASRHLREVSERSFVPSGSWCPPRATRVHRC